MSIKIIHGSRKKDKNRNYRYSIPYSSQKVQKKTMVQLLVDACICLTVCVCKNDESYADNENPIIKTKTKKEFATNEKKILLNLLISVTKNTVFQ